MIAMQKGSTKKKNKKGKIQSDEKLLVFSRDVC